MLSVLLCVLCIGVFYTRVICCVLCQSVCLDGICCKSFFKRGYSSRTFEEVECDEEELTKNIADERPDVFSLAMIIVALSLYIVSEVGSVLQSINCGRSIQEFLPQCVNILILFVRCLFIAVIFYNVLRKRLFDSSNPVCIYAVGATLIVNAILQHSYLETVTGQVAIYYYVSGILIIFFARMFDITVKLKKEHDLTI